MLQVFDLSKSYGNHQLFSKINFSISDGEKVGLVARNGHGKSTLFKIIIGEELPDQGKVVLTKNYRLGYLKQQIQFTKDKIIDECSLALPDDQKENRYQVEAVLLGLGFKKEEFILSPNILSGGFQVRLNLAKVLVSGVEFLLLDEPTNYLDIVSLRWLTRFLRTWPHEIFMITHDREFMDSIVTHIIGIHRKECRKIKGKTADLFQKIQQEEAVYEKTRINEERKSKEIQDFVNKFRAKARQGALVQSRVKMLAKLDEKEKLQPIQQLDFSFNHAPFNGKWPLSIKDLSFGYGQENAKENAEENIKSAPPLLIKNFSMTIGSKDRVAIIGKNGKGKTTLLNLLGQKLIPTSGKIELAANLKMAFFEQTNRETLNPNASVEEEIRSANAELPYSRVRGICGTMMFSGDDAKKMVKVLSGGEKSRVLLGKILATACNLLLLDEPTNHLDLEAANALLESLQSFPGTIIIVTHNEMILKKLATRLIVFQKNTVLNFDYGYEDFMQKVGLEEEIVLNDGSIIPNTQNTQKEYRRFRQQIVEERSRLLTPLQKQLSKNENRILELETTNENLREQLVMLTSSGERGQGEKIASCSKQISEIDKELKNLYPIFDKLVEEIESIKENYQQKLDELEVGENYHIPTIKKKL